jgi:hypothetical protein
MRRFRECPDENEIQVSREFSGEILEACVAKERDIVPLSSAPDGDYLRHDARQVCVHYACPQ